jgi:hypothetical protein
LWDAAVGFRVPNLGGGTLTPQAGGAMVRPVKCQELRDALSRAVTARDDFQQQMGDLADQGIPLESLRRQLASLDKWVESANMQLHLCLNPPKPSPSPKPRTPEPQRILDIQNADPSGAPGYQNADFKPDLSRGNWAYDFVGGHTFIELKPSETVWEWTPILDKTNEYDVKMAAIAGTVVQPDISGNDVPFTHPFGMDWECYISPDVDFESLLAPTNKIPTDQGLFNAVAYAREVLGLDTPGLLGLETDSDLVPQAFQPSEGDRIIAYGRWIVDAGHTDFHTEIHPPLLMASAHSLPNGGTASTLVSRPYLVSQEFGDGAIRQHLLNEIAKIMPVPGVPLPLCLLTVRSTRVEANPRVFRMPFEGNKYMSYVVRPRTHRTDSTDKLVVSFALSVRPGVRVWLFDEDSDDAIRVLVYMDGDKYVPAPLPRSHNWDFSINDLNRIEKNLGTWIKVGLAGLQISQVFTPDPLAGTVVDYYLDRGVRTRRYDPPSYVTPVMSTVNAEELPGVSHFTVDETQSFPVLGWLNVYWESSQRQASESNCERLRNALATLNGRIEALQGLLIGNADKASVIREIRSLENQLSLIEIELEKAKCP